MSTMHTVHTVHTVHTMRTVHTMHTVHTVHTMHTMCLLGGDSGWCLGLTTLPPSCANCLEILRASTSWNPQGPVQACTRVALIFNYFNPVYRIYLQCTFGLW